MTDIEPDGQPREASPGPAAVAPAPAEQPARAEFLARTGPGWTMAAAALAAAAAAVALLATGGSGPSGTPGLVIGILLAVAAVITARGLTPVAPGRARVVLLLGRYTGTIRSDGLHWVNPLATRLVLSTRIRNHETAVARV